MEIVYGCGSGILNLSGRNDPEKSGNTAVALGFFDGVHKGHVALLNELKRLSVSEGLESVVYTFVNHPASVTGRGTRLLCSNRLKAEYIAETGVDRLIFRWFDREFSQTDPEAFVRDVLAGELRAKIVVAGDNYSFGRGGNGKSSDLVRYCGKYGMKAVIIPRVSCLLGDKTVTVSSSLLRELVTNGKMKEYEIIAGRYFALEGTVRRGREEGREMGFPTANIYPDKNIVLPEKGVYATLTRVAGRPGGSYKSITNVGTNPTFGPGGQISIETNLLDFEGDIYGSGIRIEMIEKMRGEKRFSSPEELKKQLKEDALRRRTMV